MSQNNPDLDEPEELEDDIEPCKESHVGDLDAQTKQILSTFSTIRSKISDLERAESDLKRFELSIEQDRKRLAKQRDTARQALRNARVQMAVELQKVDGIGFAKAADLIKEANRA